MHFLVVFKTEKPFVEYGFVPPSPLGAFLCIYIHIYKILNGTTFLILLHNHIIYTLHLRSVRPHATVWGKTTLSGPSNLNNEYIFSYVLGTSYTNLQQFPKIGASGGGALKQKFPIFTTIKKKNFVREFLLKLHFGI